MFVFPGKSNITLAQEIVKKLGGSLGIVDSDKFANGEARVRIDQPTDGRISDSAALLQSLSMPVDEHIVEYCLIADALNRMGVSNLIGIIPWMGYSKQDKVFLPGEALSAKVAAQILQTTKTRKIITFDLHNRAILGFFDIPVTELSAKPLFKEYFHKRLTDKTVVVSPDEGSVKASSYFARELNVPIVYMDKRRDLMTGEVEVVGMSGDVTGAHVIIVDDMIVTGSTAMETAKYLKGKGATNVTIAATHHLYVPGVQEELEKSDLDEIVVTNTVETPAALIQTKKLTVLSVAEIITQNLKV
jgi:ribose-phosphate pyrophosphokinase